MSSKIDQAIQSGYSEDEILDYLSKDNPKIKNAKKAGYSNEEIFNYLKTEKSKEKVSKESTGKKTARSAVQLPLGRLETTPAGLAASALQMFGTGEALAELDELEERLPELREKFPGFNIPEKIDREKYLQATQAASETFPTVGNISRMIEEKTGAPLTPKSGLDKALRFVSSASGFAKGTPTQQISKGLKAESVKQALEASGVPEPVAEGLALYTAAHEKTPKISKTKEKPLETKTPQTPVQKIEIKKMKSGLTEPKAVEGEYSKLATISPARQQASIEKLNKEATELSKKAVEKHLPIIKQIEEGFDFEGQFEKRFGDLKKMAEKANPTIDISPISKFLQETRKKYKGLPTPHPEAKKILNEIVNFREAPQTELGNLLKIYRSNNKKKRHIYEGAMIHGKQQEYVDFLDDMNRAISESFKKTFPEDSAWMKEFLENNKTYSQYQKAQKTLNSLKPFLEGDITPAKVNRLATDSKTQKKLAVNMGKEGAADIIQIAKDLKKASDAIKKIPTKELKAWDAIFPVGMIIPFIKIPATIAAAGRGANFARNLYGYYLSTPAKRIALDDSLKAIASEDIKAYEAATKKLKAD